jgi:hypothetical protein
VAPGVAWGRIGRDPRCHRPPITGGGTRAERHADNGVGPATCRRSGTFGPNGRCDILGERNLRGEITTSEYRDRRHAMR